MGRRACQKIKRGRKPTANDIPPVQEERSPSSPQDVKPPEHYFIDGDVSDDKEMLNDSDGEELEWAIDYIIELNKNSWALVKWKGLKYPSWDRVEDGELIDEYGERCSAFEVLYHSVRKEFGEQFEKIYPNVSSKHDEGHRGYLRDEETVYKASLRNLESHYDWIRNPGPRIPSEETIVYIFDWTSRENRDLPKFEYLSRTTVSENAQAAFKRLKIKQTCRCEMFKNCENCPCKEHGRTSYIGKDRVIDVDEDEDENKKDAFYDIVECGRKCHCMKYRDVCFRSVVQLRSRKATLAVFRHPVKNWTLRTLQKINKGHFVCDYKGKIMTIDESKESLYEITSEIELDNGEVVTLVVDSEEMGNEGRFLAHSCDPNMRPYVVLEDRLIAIAFFAIEDIEAGTELTFDYLGEGAEEKEGFRLPFVCHSIENLMWSGKLPTCSGTKTTKKKCG